jgi:hypothetical protein
MLKIFVFIFGSVLWTRALSAGQFTGQLILFPEGCQNFAPRICKLGSILTYRDPKNMIWQTDQWSGDDRKSGTTDGASIPPWAQKIIGRPYDASYLKAAIIHDHYCFQENHVRSWRRTHRMFYDAMVDLKVSKFKAKLMYYAVFVFGPHWVKIVPGENCGENCVKKFALSAFDVYLEKDRFDSPEMEKQLSELKSQLLQTDLSLQEIEDMAKRLNPQHFFFAHGNTFSP